MSSQGKRNRRKGHDLERWVANYLGWLAGGSDDGVEIAPSAHQVSRGYQYKDATSSDVEGTYFRIECKSGKSAPIRGALAQLEKDGKKFNDNRFPLVFVKDHGKKEPFVVMPLDTFRAMVENTLCWGRPCPKSE